MGGEKKDGMSLLDPSEPFASDKESELRLHTAREPVTESHCPLAANWTLRARRPVPVDYLHAV